MKPYFLRLPLTKGGSALVRADAITTILPQTVKGESEVLIQTGPTLTLHAAVSEEEVLRTMAQMGVSPIIQEIEREVAA